MNNKLQDSVTSHETTVSETSKASSISGAKKKCYGLLFSCFKVNRKRQSKENFVRYEPKEYDYIVEKLVVKRVPFVFFTISENALETKSDVCNEDTQKSLATAEVNTIYSTGSETHSLLYCSDKLNGNMEIPNKCLHFGANMTALNERDKRSILSTNYNTKITKLMNTMSSLHPNLKECKNIPKNNKISSKEVKEIAFIQEILNRNDNSQIQETFTSFPTTSVQDSFLMKKELKDLKSPMFKSKKEQKSYNLKEVQGMYTNEPQDDDNAQNNKTFIAQPVQNVFYNFANFKKTIIDTNQLSVENCNLEHTNIKSQINNRLSYNQQMYVNKSKLLVDNIINTDPSNITLRWKIIVRHYKPKTLHYSKDSQQITKYCNIN
ncbi:uncharacterized protein LOC143154196 [Ptiloglossa arizonensis]|uniref:uncharacterized protein LOC143154196 n=1 Tax=Ptiloglossa arizonensis TaxID=3350558 RepID=UPI003FA083CC